MWQLDGLKFHAIIPSLRNFIFHLNTKKMKANSRHWEFTGDAIGQPIRLGTKEYQIFEVITAISQRSQGYVAQITENGKFQAYYPSKEEGAMGSIEEIKSMIDLRRKVYHNDQRK